jgi:hypothetical protein
MTTVPLSCKAFSEDAILEGMAATGKMLTDCFRPPASNPCQGLIKGDFDTRAEHAALPSLCYTIGRAHMVVRSLSRHPQDYSYGDSIKRPSTTVHVDLETGHQVDSYSGLRMASSMQLDNPHRSPQVFKKVRPTRRAFWWFAKAELVSGELPKILHQDPRQFSRIACQLPFCSSVCWTWNLRS